MVCVRTRGSPVSGCRRRGKGKRGERQGQRVSASPLGKRRLASARRRFSVDAHRLFFFSSFAKKKLTSPSPHLKTKKLFFLRTQVCMTYVPSLSAIQIYTLDEDRCGFGVVFVFCFSLFLMHRLFFYLFCFFKVFLSLADWDRTKARLYAHVSFLPPANARCFTCRSSSPPPRA